jgi:Glycosyl-hydrolase family 116, catalytic region
MTDQISGEWFSGIIGLPDMLSQENLSRAVASVFKYNFNPEFGLHNATGPKNGKNLLALNNLQAGGLWSGIEFAFASLLIDRGHFTDGIRIIEAVHRRYLRAGQPLNHVECGGHYSRAMSSWAPLLAATGFKPDVPQQKPGAYAHRPGRFSCTLVYCLGVRFDSPSWQNTRDHLHFWCARTQAVQDRTRNPVHPTQWPAT